MRSNHLSYLAKYFNELSTFPILLKSDAGRSDHLRFLTAKRRVFQGCKYKYFFILPNKLFLFIYYFYIA